MDVVLAPTPRAIVSSRLIVYCRLIRSCLSRKVEVAIVAAVVATNAAVHFTDGTIWRVASL